MKYYYVYDENFQYIGMTESQPSNSLWTDVGWTESFIRATWDGTQWVEGASSEELQLADQQRIKNLKLDCYNELVPTDWYFIRKQETGQDVPQNILDERAEIRQKYNILLGE